MKMMARPEYIVAMNWAEREEGGKLRVRFALFQLLRERVQRIRNGNVSTLL
jgi:hypothetical protein